jgi:hypothetical protein
MRLVIAIFVGVFAMIILAALTNPVAELFTDTQQSSSFNCVGYVDADDEANSYNSSLNQNSFGCTISDIAAPLWVFGILIVIILAAMYPGRPEQEMYPQY